MQRDIAERRRELMVNYDGKMNMKVTALEAAEAAKRLEEEQHEERDQRKALVKLDIAARKRRKEEEKKGDERKKKEEYERLKFQKEENKRAAAAREGKKKLVGKEARQLKSGVTGCGKAAEPMRSCSNLQSYEMSPYVDSDVEGREEGNEMRRGKHIPLWARTENLEQTLLSNKGLDPSAIFSSKKSFDLTEVLGKQYISGNMIDSAERTVVADVSPALQNLALILGEFRETGNVESLVRMPFYETPVGTYPCFGEGDLIRQPKLHKKENRARPVCDKKVLDELSTSTMMVGMSWIQDSAETKSSSCRCLWPDTSCYAVAHPVPKDNQQLQTEDIFVIAELMPEIEEKVSGRSKEEDNFMIDRTTRTGGPFLKREDEGGQCCLTGEDSTGNANSNLNEEACAPALGKRNMKVKALKAAEATKYLQERKQQQQDERNAAFKLKRERVEKGKFRSLKLEDRKTEEEQWRKEVYIAGRRRQREEVEKEKRKMRETEITRKRQREQNGRICLEKEEKKLWHQAGDERDGKQKERGKPAHRQLKSKGGVTGFRKSKNAKPTSNNLGVKDLRLAWEDLRHDWDSLVGKLDSQFINDTKKVAVEPVTPESNQDRSDEFAEPQPYEISPYMDSDTEFREEKEVYNRRGKHIPPWARKGNLNQIIVSNEKLDPLAIFGSKRSFNLDEVLGSRLDIAQEYTAGTSPRLRMSGKFRLDRRLDFI